MTPKEKAMEIAEEIGKHFSGCYTSDQDCYDSAMQMHEWTKQQMIEKACVWLNYELTSSAKYSIAEYQWLFDKCLDDFKKAMEEEL